MEFEDMQVIWNEQNSEKLYTIDQFALNKMVGKKSRSVNLQVQFVEWVLILVNLGLGLQSLYDSIWGSAPRFFVFMGIVYLLVAGYWMYLRFGRKQHEVIFADSLLGEIDKAIYRTDYLIDEGSKLVPYYLAPLMILISIFFIYTGFYWGAVVALLLLTITYFGVNWEMQKIHKPRKESLESIREAFLAEPK
ncbi:MAG: hypothetical protein AB8G95_16380 [Anaerolineae bacterium]